MGIGMGRSFSSSELSHSFGSPSSFDGDLKMGHAEYHLPQPTIPEDYQRIIKRLDKMEKVNKQNPRPDKYHIEKSIQVGSSLVLEISYPNCTNYEGKKILVYKDMNLRQLMVNNNSLVDPHFSDNPHFVSPYARFVPTQEGLDSAIELAELLSRNY